LYFPREESGTRLIELRKVLKQRNPSIRLLVSVGGWGGDGFSDAALTDTSRRKFADSIAEFINRYGLDGIDLDWEYPGQPGPGIKFRPEDKENFTLMLKAVRERLDSLSRENRRRKADRYTLSIATAGGRYFEHTEMNRLHVYVDWINMMTYDFFTSGSKTTGHHSSLTATEAMTAQHLAAGLPSRKLVVGVPFYGRSWTGVDPVNYGLSQPFEKYFLDLSYEQIERDYNGKQGFVRFRDDKAHAPYLWNAESRTFVSYDDPQSLKDKAAFIRKQHLGGVMYWEHSHDPGEVLLDVLVRTLR
jgi:chitinase